MVMSSRRRLTSVSLCGQGDVGRRSLFAVEGRECIPGQEVKVTLEVGKRFRNLGHVNS